MVNLEHDKLEPFEPILDFLHPLVFEYGIAALQKAGDLTNPTDVPQVIERSTGAHRRFIRGCHYGWELAQRRIAELVVSYEEELRKLRDTLKSALRRRDRDAALAKEDLIECFEARQIVLRRLADTILYHQVKLQNWVLRRLSQEYRIRNIDPAVIRKTITIASDLNREERFDFHLVSDLTTAVHVGDLVKVSFSSHPPAWSLIELKDGKMNAVLADEIEKAGGELKDEHLEKIRDQFGAKAAAQAKRIARQEERHRNVMKVLTTDEGIEIVHGTRIKLAPDVVYVDDYAETLRAACQKARANGIAVSIVDGAFRIVVMKAAVYEKQGRGGVAHLLFHYQFGKKECELKTKAEDELTGMRSIYPFFDLVHMNLYAMWPPPIFLWHMPHDMILDLLFGRIVAFAQLDYSKLFEAAERRRIQMRWVGADELGEMRKVSARIPGSPGANAIGVKLMDRPEVHEQFLLIGFFSRIFLEFMSPSQLITLMGRTFDDTFTEQREAATGT